MRTLDRSEIPTCLTLGFQDRLAYHDLSSLPARASQRCVALPLALPGLAAIFIYGFVTNWHDFLFAKTLINSQSLWAEATGISSFRGEYFTLLELQMAAALVFALPVIIVFLIMQRRIVLGTLAGSVC
ncbi:hypothetical protein [Nitratireductor sp. B36]|uniref:hypothetical protein n=1 Tax=Nitratireductor sp. B36 TaxID=2762059 RepID=UPI001E48DCA2|nr:hypothetical protein [Nitratireductor sp. B36]